MATVRISEYIRGEVRDKIRALFGVREKAAEDSLATVDVGHEVLCGTLPNDQLRTAIALNEKAHWMNTHNMINVLIQFTDHKGRQQKMVFRTTVRPKLPLPISLTTYSSPAVEMTSAMPSYEKVAAIARNIYQIKDDCSELQAAVSKILNQCTTLRQVLEIWPSALDYMPDEIKKRHAEKAQKREAAQIDDVGDDTKTLLMKARLLASP